MKRKKRREETDACFIQIEAKKTVMVFFQLNKVEKECKSSQEKVNDDDDDDEVEK